MVGEYRNIEEGLLYTDKSGRESIYPSSLVFMRKTGKRYIEVGMEKDGRESLHYIKSIDTGKIVKMFGDKLIKFKNT